MFVCVTSAKDYNDNKYYIYIYVAFENSHNFICQITE